jgi:hypothetical protein
MATLIGGFVALFLLFFQPFGLHNVPAGLVKIIILVGYGVVSFLCINLLALAVPALFPDWFKPEKWTVGKEIAFMLLNFLVVGLANFLYTIAVFHYPFRLSVMLYFQLITLSVGIFPVVIMVLWRHSRLLTRNLKLAREMNTGLTGHHQVVPVSAEQQAAVPHSGTETLFTFTSETGTEQITMAPADFLFAAAADNYAELHYLENGSYKKSLIRSSLSRIEEAVKDDANITRCHRTYLVNLDQVRSFSGNAQGLKLALHHTDLLVPVSRKMVSHIKALL